MLPPPPTVNKRAVRIPVECILVNINFHLKFEKMSVCRQIAILLKNELMNSSNSFLSCFNAFNSAFVQQYSTYTTSAYDFIAYFIARCS